MTRALAFTVMLAVTISVFLLVVYTVTVIIRGPA